MGDFSNYRLEFFDYGTTESDRIGKPGELVYIPGDAFELRHQIEVCAPPPYPSKYGRWYHLFWVLSRRVSIAVFGDCGVMLIVRPLH